MEAILDLFVKKSKHREEMSDGMMFRLSLAKIGELMSIILISFFFKFKKMILSTHVCANSYAFFA